MNKLLLIVLFTSFSFIARSQQEYLMFKKRDKVIERFWPGSIIAFQLSNKQWQKGEITLIRKDSFYMRPIVVIYNAMSRDTVHYNVTGFALHDVFAMPNDGIRIDFNKGRNEVSRADGHVHFYWVKSGWIFRAGAIGYTALNVANGIIKNDFAFKGSKLGIAAGVFLLGVLLKNSYRAALPLRKKYYLQTSASSSSINNGSTQ
jgi:hypothetical protein